MAERLTPYLLRRTLALPLADKAALIGHLNASINVPSSPEDRLQYLLDKMQEVSGIDVRDLSRKRETVTARTVFVFVARREGFSQPFIAAFIGRDHSTIAYAEKRMRDVFTYPNAFKDEIYLYHNYVESL